MKRHPFQFNTMVEVDNETGIIVAVYLRVREGKVAKTRELVPGDVFADYNSRRELLGVELLAPCPVSVIERIALREPAPVKSFLPGNIPSQMILSQA